LEDRKKIFDIKGRGDTFPRRLEEKELDASLLRERRKRGELSSHDGGKVLFPYLPPDRYRHPWKRTGQGVNQEGGKKGVSRITLRKGGSRLRLLVGRKKGGGTLAQRRERKRVVHLVFFGGERKVCPYQVEGRRRRIRVISTTTFRKEGKSVENYLWEGALHVGQIREGEKKNSD